MGSPTVIVEAGLGGLSLSWRIIQQGVSATTTACTYDRAGLGWSQQGPEPRDAVHQARELRALLDAAEIAPPLVLVGYSYGAFPARVFIAEYPGLVRGAVLLDGSHPSEWQNLSERRAASLRRTVRTRQIASALASLGVVRVYRAAVEAGWASPPTSVAAMLEPYDDATRKAYLTLWAMPKYARTLAQEWAALPLSAAQVGDGRELRDLPLAVLTPETVPEERMQAEKALAGASVLGRHVIVEGAGHDFPFRRPDVVIQAIVEVVEQVRATGSPGGEW